jgi:hypothetical protein
MQDSIFLENLKKRLLEGSYYQYVSGGIPEEIIKAEYKEVL